MLLTNTARACWLAGLLVGAILVSRANAVDAIGPAVPLSAGSDAQKVADLESRVGKLEATVKRLESNMESGSLFGKPVRVWKDGKEPGPGETKVFTPKQDGAFFINVGGSGGGRGSVWIGTCERVASSSRRTSAPADPESSGYTNSPILLVKRNEKVCVRNVAGRYPIAGYFVPFGLEVRSEDSDSSPAEN